MFKIQLLIFKFFFIFFKKGYPFGALKWGSKETYLNIYKKIKNKNYIQIDKYEEGLKNKIDINWLNELALQTQVVIKKNEINYQHGRILYAELSNYIKQRNARGLNVLETGTARGFSSVCMSKAIDDNNCDGKIHTIDILPNNKRIYWNCISDIEGKKTRPELLNNWSNYIHRIKFYTGNSIKVLKKINLDRVNFAFLDGSHNKTKVEIEFNWVKERQLKNDIIVFDDYDPHNFKGIYEFINNLEKENNYKITKIFSEIHRGYAIARKL